MPLYSAAASMSGINTAARAYFTLSPSSTRKQRIYRLAIAMPVACSTVPSFQVLRQTVAGVTPGASFAPIALDPGDPASGGLFASGGFGTQPTLTTSTPLDMASLPLTAGAGWVWNFPTPIEVTLGTANGIAIYNLNASGATTGTFIGSVLFEE